MATWARDPSLGMELFAHAVESLEPLVEASDAAAELHARVLFEYGESRATFHDLHGSIVTLARARAAASACRRPSPFLVLRTEIALRMFRNSVLEDPRGWEPLNRRLTEMREVAAAAHATGSVDLSLRALNAVAQLEAASGDASAALYAARSALALSNYHPAAEVYSETVVRMARTVMYTPLWQEVPALLHRAGPPATIAVAAQRRTLEAEYALRTKSYAHARQLLAQHRGAPRPFMNVLAAQAAHALGSPREACRQIEAALPAVERSGIAKTIERTYRIAARVTGDGRFGRKAEEIARAIGA